MARAPTAGAPAGSVAEHEPDAAAGEAAALGPPAQLSAWQQLLAELDRLLRDPTLTRALKAFAANVAGGLRGAAAMVLDAARRVARALARIRLPRRLLLALLALALPLALLALLNSGDDQRPAPPGGSGSAAQPASGAAGGGGLSLPAVGMPEVLAQPDAVRPVNVALVLDRTYDPPQLRRELRALGAWLDENHAPGTRVSVIDAVSARASPPLRAERLADADASRRRASTASAIRTALARGNGRDLLVTLGATERAPRTARTLRIATRPGAATGSSAALEQRRRARVTIDDRRPNALAASVARAIMAISGEREKR
ncbi:MAG: hypothetical protein KY463_00825 [Actinobacteria bacterium]|nr:hypothetical protein [Actinomycetota bacterium]